MAFRRAYFLLSIFIGFLACLFTLWRTYSLQPDDPVQVALRSVGVGSAVIVAALVIFHLIARFDNTPK